MIAAMVTIVHISLSGSGKDRTSTGSNAAIGQRGAITTASGRVGATCYHYLFRVLHIDTQLGGNCHDRVVKA